VLQNSRKWAGLAAGVLLLAVLFNLTAVRQAITQGMTTIRGLVTADTELPAAGAISSDNQSAPTAPAVYAYQMCFDGSTWDRCTSSADTELPAAAALADNTSNPTVPGVAAFLMCWDGSNWDRCASAGADTELPTPATLADATANPSLPAVASYLMCFNGTTWDRCAPNVAHDASASSQNPVLMGGYASAAAPSDVSADTDAVRAWFLRNGAQSIQQTFAGILATTGAGGTGTGVQRVIEANDSQLSAGVGATGDSAATAGSTGSLTAKARLMTTQLDAIQTAVQLLDNAVSGAGVNVSQIGGATPDVCATKAKLYIPISQVTSTQLFTGTASNRTYLCSLMVTQPAASTQTFALVSGTGTTCGTSVGAMIGGTTAANGMQLPFSLGNGLGQIAKSDTDADNVCLLQSSTDRIAGVLSYVVATN